MAQTDLNYLIIEITMLERLSSNSLRHNTHTHVRARTHAHARTHARTHTHTHTNTHTPAHLHGLVEDAAPDLHHLQILLLLVAGTLDVGHPAALILLAGVTAVAHSSLSLRD